MIQSWAGNGGLLRCLVLAVYCYSIGCLKDMEAGSQFRYLALLKIRKDWSLLFSWLGKGQNQKNRREHRRQVGNPAPASEPCPLLTQLLIPYTIRQMAATPHSEKLTSPFPLLSASPWELLQNLTPLMVRTFFCLNLFRPVLHPFVIVPNHPLD